MDQDLPVRRRQFLAGVAGLAGAAAFGAQRNCRRSPGMPLRAGFVVISARSGMVQRWMVMLPGSVA